MNKLKLLILGLPFLLIGVAVTLFSNRVDTTDHHLMVEKAFADVPFTGGEGEAAGESQGECEAEAQGECA
jgi:hypothetical protein